MRTLINKTFGFAARAAGAVLASGALALSASAGTTVSWATAAEKDAFCLSNGYDYSLRLDGIANDLVFSPAGEFVQRDDGSATLTGFLESALHPELEFLVQLSFSGGSATGNPILALSSSAYSSNGGPIDPATWSFYPTFSGRLVGVGALKGAHLNIVGTSDFQVGAGASGANAAEGAFGHFHATTVSQALSGPVLPTSTDGDLAFGTSGDSGLCSQDGVADSSAVWATDHAFVLLGGLGNWKLIGNGQFKELANGTGMISGTIEKTDVPANVFNFTIDLAGRLDFGDVGYPPVGSPKKELASSAYVENGGPIDTNTWHYYTSVNGSFVGAGGLAGALVTITGSGSALQVGFGANGKNVDFGVASWLDMTVVQQPNQGNPLKDTFGGDLNLNLNTDCEEWPSAAVSNPSAIYNTDHAFTFFGVADNFVFQPNSGLFTEFGDGTATLTGAIMRDNDACKSFSVDLFFDGRVDPIDANYPPNGSPKLELVASSYINNGGTINPATWHYYTTTTGTFSGLGCYAGAVISATRMGPAFQVGYGASGKNFEYGGSGWMTMTTLVQPNDTSIHFPQTFQSDCNINLGECPPVGLTSYGASCPGSSHFAPTMSLLGAPDAGNEIGIAIDHALGGAPYFLIIGMSKIASPLPTGCMENVGNVLLVLPAPPLDGVGPGNGSTLITRKIPAVSSPITYMVEAMILDPQAMGGVAVTNGIVVDCK